MIRIVDSSQVGKLLARKAARFTEAEEAVRPILDNVRKRGDKALLEYARKFDKFQRKTPLVSQPELNAAADNLTPDFRNAIATASENIRAFARLQLPEARSSAIAPGLLVGQVIRPLDVVAAYIPAGRYPLPSTLMMTVIPSQVAGVGQVYVTTPRAVPEILGTAALLKADKVF